MDYYDEVRTASENALESLSGDWQDDPETFLIDAYRGTQVFNPGQRRATYEELVAASRLDLIRQDNLRTAATYYYSYEPPADSAAQMVRSSGYRAIFARYTSPDFHRLIAQRCGDRYDVQDLNPLGAVTLTYPCALEASPQDIEQIAIRLRQAPDLEPTLRHHIILLDRAIASLSTYLPILDTAQPSTPSASAP
jgi:hypothetical protein